MDRVFDDADLVMQKIKNHHALQGVGCSIFIKILITGHIVDLTIKIEGETTFMYFGMGSPAWSVGNIQCNIVLSPVVCVSVEPPSKESGSACLHRWGHEALSTDKAY